MGDVRAKKHLGQHFLTDLDIAQKIVDSLQDHGQYKTVIEVGPGMGVLTDFLLEKHQYNLTLIDLDRESVSYLQHKYVGNNVKIIGADFLQMNLEELSDNMAIIGNFPYNISSQIMFKVIDYKHIVKEVVGMFQKEVAERLASGPGNRDYGILSVLLQAYYDIEYLFTVPEHVFNPPPKVKSGVIRLKRNTLEKLPCDEVLFKKVVKTAFAMRRKTLRNTLKALNLPQDFTQSNFFDKRAEQLSVADFIKLTQDIQNTNAS
jgi:16S rRNA (adenine1518-N6/adenine1519-N6)-dimethyltransferase